MLLKYLLFLFFTSYAYSYKIEKYYLRMPYVQPNVEDLYLCTPVRVNFTKNYYILGFEPVASEDTIHHMLLYGCAFPGSTISVWNCGEMVSTEKGVNSYNPCMKKSQIIYAWARDAPKLTLPKDVGFKVGGDSPIQYLVLQVHYSHIDKFRDGKTTDNSGINLYYTEKKMPKLAGVLLLGTGGWIQPFSTEHMETSCEIKEDKILHPFAFRTHTHELGKVVSAYKVRNISGENEWILIGKKDPLLPEMFYPVENPVVLKKNDIVAARCTMKSNRPEITYVGPTNLHEMCNYYIMYWVEGDEPLKKKYCFTRGPPLYYWKTVGGFNNIPDDEASSLD